MKKWIPSLLFITVAFFWAIILKSEFVYVLKWWAVFLLIGLMFYPLSMTIFSTFTDKGYTFSKVLGLAIVSYTMWILSRLKLLQLTTLNGWVLVILCGIILYFLFFRRKRPERIKLIEDHPMFWIVTGETLFLCSLAFWTYLRGFNPKIEGLEKFMDYGFVNTILRSGFVPPKDMWFAGESINYYYFGQYITAFLTRLSGLKTEITYNLMMATLFAFSMVLCFTLVTNLIKGHGVKKKTPVIIGGLVSSLLVSLGGNLHSFFYGLFWKYTNKGKSYWFPDATRYIGYNPETRDKTIHEFPLYSFVVSDLHAHVINMIFVLTFLGVLIAIFRKLQKRRDEGWQPSSPLGEFFLPEMILLGLFIGIFQMSNYWDFPIYLTVMLFTFFCAGIRQFSFTKKLWSVTTIRFVGTLMMSLVFAFPFNQTFEKVTTGIMYARDKSLPHQLFVLWGYQLVLVIIFFGLILYGEQNLSWKKEKGETRLKIRREMTLLARLRTVLEKSTVEDVFAVILCVSAIGLVIIPELVYVKDIYGAEHKRANTMFKLTYQAFIMFGLAAGYITARIYTAPKTDWKVITARIAAVIMIILPLIYPLYAIPSWYKDMDPVKYEGLDGLAFLKNEYPDDYALVEWLRENIQGQPTILEANGDSYSYHGRISMATGLPTVLGWYVHEWLWRDDSSLVQSRADEVKTIYESDDLGSTEELLEKYQVEYIVIGELEYEKFQSLKEDKLLSLGNVVFELPDIKLIQVR